MLWNSMQNSHEFVSWKWSLQRNFTAVADYMGFSISLGPGAEWVFFSSTIWYLGAKVWEALTGMVGFLKVETSFCLSLYLHAQYKPSYRQGVFKNYLLHLSIYPSAHSSLSKNKQKKIALKWWKELSFWRIQTALGWILTLSLISCVMTSLNLGFKMRIEIPISWVVIGTKCGSGCNSALWGSQAICKS